MARNRCALQSAGLGHGRTLDKWDSKWLSIVDYIVDEAFALVVVSAILLAGKEEKFVVNVAVVFDFHFVNPFAAHFWEVVLQTGRITELALLAVHGNLLVDWQPVEAGHDE